MKKRPIYYDTETTGIKSDKDRIIEIAAFDPVENRTFVELINPGIPIPPDATQIHKITDEMVKNAPTFQEIGKAFIDFCGNENVILIAHNNDAFDKLFLEAEFKRSHLSEPNWAFLDSLKWARKYRPDLPRHSLQHLREVYEIPPNQAHRALDDVMVLYQVFSAMIDDIPIEKVQQLLQAPQTLTRMLWGKYQGKPLNQVPKDYIQWLKASGALDKQENAVLRQSFEKMDLVSTSLQKE